MDVFHFDKLMQQPKLIKILRRLRIYQYASVVSTAVRELCGTQLKGSSLLKTDNTAAGDDKAGSPRDIFST